MVICSSHPAIWVVRCWSSHPGDSRLLMVRGVSGLHGARRSRLGLPACWWPGAAVAALSAPVAPAAPHGFRVGSRWRARRSDRGGLVVDGSVPPFALRSPALPTAGVLGSAMPLVGPRQQKGSG